MHNSDDQAHPLDADKCVQAGMYWFGRGDISAAEAWWRRALYLEPNHARAQECLRALERQRYPDQHQADQDRPLAGLNEPPLEIELDVSEFLINPKTPWDEGPSRTSILTVKDDSPELDSIADAIEIVDPVEMAAGATLPRAPSTTQEILAAGRNRFQLHDFAGAAELLEDLVQRDPLQVEALQLLTESRAQLAKMYESKLGSIQNVPRVLVANQELIWLNMNHRAGFILAQIDGTLSYDDIIALSGMPRLEALQILSELIQDQVIGAG